MTGLLSINSAELLEDKAYQVLREAIISLQLLPRQHLLEREISDQLGISKTPIKNALVRLQREGFAKQEPYRGMYVSSITTRSIMEISQLRQALEGFAVSLAALQPDRAAMEALHRSCAGALEAVHQGNMDQFATFNDQFHRYFIEALGNSQYLLAWNTVNDHVHRLRMVLNQSRTVENIQMYILYAEQHVQILESVEQGNPAQASALMASHIGSFTDLLVTAAHSGSLPLIEVP